NAITGPITIAAGALQVSNGGALGTGTIYVSPSANIVGSALQLSGGITLANPIVPQGNNNVKFGGINFGGQVQSVSGSNTLSGPIAVNYDLAFGADLGATLNLSGVITNTGVRAVAFAGAGTINVLSVLTSSYYAIEKHGSGLLNLSAANPITLTNNLTLYGGTLALNGGGTLSGATTIAATVNPGATLLLDNSAAAISGRLGTRPITLGGNLTLTGSAGTSVSETFGALTPLAGASVITLNGGSAALNVASIGTVPTGATFLVRGTNLGAGSLDAGTATFATTTTGVTFVGGTGATGSKNKGILPWALVDSSATGFGATGIGTSFATTDSAAATTGTVGAIWRPLSASEYDTTLVSGNNVVLSSGVALSTGTLALNSLTLNSGGGVSLQATQTLTISSGGLLLQDGNSGISGGILSSGATSLWVFTPSNTGATSSISSALTGTFALTKSGAGTLVLGGTAAGFPTLSANTFTGQTTINE
ncbi:MAG: hypothetical protein EBR81_15840, partial [Proteobacteria bacterium]|nr:hypothetical protein [Pseudomonadota bacterium]